MNKRILGGLAAAAMLTGGVAFMSAGTASATTELCPDNDEGYGPKTNYGGSGATVDYIARNGFLVAGYCVKAGSDTEQSGGGVEFVTVNPPMKMVTIDHPTKDSVSHYSVKLVPEPTEVTPKFSSTLPTCLLEGTASPVLEDGIAWAKVGDIWEASPTKGYVFPDGATTKFGPFNLAKLTENCSTPPPPTPEILTPPAQTPPTQSSAGPVPVPAVAVAAFPPVQAVPAQAPAPAPAPSATAPAGGLPATGIDGSGVTALIALLLTSLGGAALVVSRRYNVTT